MRKEKVAKLHKKKMPKMRVAFILIFLFPALSHLAIFWLPVQIQSFALAFTKYETNTFTLFGNFIDGIKVVTNGSTNLGMALKNTSIWFVVGIADGFLSFFAAYMLYKNMWGSAFVRTVLYLPGAVSSFMMAMVFQQLFVSEGPIVHLLNDVLHLGIRTPIKVEYAMQEMIVYQVWISLGGGLIVWFGAMGRIPTEVNEYGKLIGLGPFREFVSVIIPLIWPTFCTVMTFKLIGFFGSSGPVLLFTEGMYGTYTLSYWMFDVVYSASRNMYGMAVAVGLMMTILSLPLVFGGRWFMNKFGEEVEY